MRFVNTATSNFSPSMRRWSSECDETSIATDRTPWSTSARSTRCNSTGPGVVSPAPPSTGVPALPSKTPSVPIDAERAPGASSRCRRMPTVVVLPFVPVTAAMRSAFAGSSKAAAAAIAAARRPSRTTMDGSEVRPGCSTIATDAPRPAASSRYSWPSCMEPFTAMNIAPVVTARLSSVMSPARSGSAP